MTQIAASIDLWLRNCGDASRLLVLDGPFFHADALDPGIIGRVQFGDDVRVVGGDVV